jgi:hypothetical protein
LTLSLQLLSISLGPIIEDEKEQGTRASFCWMGDSIAEDFWLVSGKRSEALAVYPASCITECKCPVWKNITWLHPFNAHQRV